MPDPLTCVLALFRLLINVAHCVEVTKDADEALLNTPYTASDNQDLVGEKYKMNFLQELNKEKHQGTQYKGINDDLLAGKVPTTKSEKSKSEQKSFSTVGSHQNKHYG